MIQGYWTIHENATTPAFLTVLPTASLPAVIESLTGRYPGPWLGKNLHRKGVCYCASRNPRSGVVVRRSTSHEAIRLAGLIDQS